MIENKKIAAKIVADVEENLKVNGNRLSCQLMRRVALKILPLPPETKFLLESAQNIFLTHLPEHEQPKHMTWQHLREAMREMARYARHQFFSSNKEFNEQLMLSAEALAYAMDEIELSRKFYPKNRNLNLDSSWGYCFWCWRIIFNGIGNTSKRDAKCDLHDINGVEYVLYT